MTFEDIIEKLQPYIDSKKQPYNKPTICIEYCRGRYNTELHWIAKVDDNRGCMVMATSLDEVLNRFNDKLIEMGYYE